MKTLARMGCFIGVVSVSACRRDAPRPQAGSATEGVVAVVGSDRIDADTLRRIAASQGVSVASARDSALFDALFAAFAREHFPPTLVSQAERIAAARALLEELNQRANAQGPPTDDEVFAATERRFWELDRPPLLRTTHAVVRVKKPEDDGPARAVAERIAGAVADSRDAVGFRAIARGVPAGGLDVRIEDLDPVARDGRVLDPEKPPPPGSTPGRYAAAYVEAAYAIRDVGDKSPVTKSEFGYHVILATERIPENRIPIGERRRILAAEIIAGRAEKLGAEILDVARKATPVEVERAAIELTERVKATQ